MKIQIIIYLLALLVMIGCSSLKKSMITTGSDLKETAIHNAILDFSKRCDLFKKDSVFHVTFEDSVFHKAVLVQVYEKNYTHAWKRGSLYDGIVKVGILAHRVNSSCDECCDKFLYTAQTTVGSKGTPLPSRYIEKNGKLFYWQDNDYALTEEMLAILWKYNLLCDDTDGMIGIPTYTIDDRLKGAHYYLCKNDLSKYKRIVTWIASGYYELPKLKCAQ